MSLFSFTARPLQFRLKHADLCHELFACSLLKAMCGGWCVCHDSRQCRSAVLHLGMFKDRLTAVIRKPILASPTHHYSGPDCPDTHRWKAPPAGGAVPPKALRLPILSRNRRHLLLHCSLLRPQVTNFALVTRRKQAKHPASSITSVCQPWHGRASSSHSLAASSRSCSQHTQCPLKTCLQILCIKPLQHLSERALRSTVPCQTVLRLRGRPPASSSSRTLSSQACPCRVPIGVVRRALNFSSESLGSTSSVFRLHRTTNTRS